MCSVPMSSWPSRVASCTESPRTSLARGVNEMSPGRSSLHYLREIALFGAALILECPSRDYAQIGGYRVPHGRQW
jgi:hypothetical protein